MSDTLDLFPLNSVLVPGASLRLHILEDRYKLMIGSCIEHGVEFGVLLDRNGQETGDDLDPVDVGTTAEIAEVTELPQGRLHVVTRGVRRFHVTRFVKTKPFWTAEVSYLEDAIGPPDAALRLRATALERFRDYLQALLQLSGRELDAVGLPEDPAASSFLIADALQVDLADKQSLLESPSAAERLTAELRLLERETRRLRAEKASESGDDDADQRRNTLKVRISLN
jgi:Lon protease-like protein